MSRWQARLRRLRQRLEQAELDALLVAHLPNILYLTNFHGSRALLIVMPRRALVFTDALYRHQARREVRGAEIIVVAGPLYAAAGEWLRAQRARRLGFEELRLTVAGYRQLSQALGKNTRLVPTQDFVESLRAVKEPAEIVAIRRAARLTQRVFEEVLPMIRSGVRECELAAELEYRMKCYGAQASAFETIVASGPRAACPHARASPKRLRKNELVVIDLGAILHDYCSDMSRTVFLGKPSARLRRVYRAVQRAQQRAFDAVRAGVQAGEVATAARRTLVASGLGHYVLHGLGHGVGLEIHEAPRLGQDAPTPLAAANVVTLEPGIYVPGWGGVRIEDVVVVRSGGAERLTPTPHELIVL